MKPLNPKDKKADKELDKRLQSDYRKMMRKYRYWKK